MQDHAVLSYDSMHVVPLTLVVPLNTLSAACSPACPLSAGRRGVA